MNDNLASLAKKVDAEVGKNSDMRAAFVFLSNEEGLEAKIKTFSQKEGLKNVSFGIDNPVGPPAWKIAKEADVTAILYKGRKFAANHAFKKGGLDAKGVDAIVGDISKIK
jgi:pantothenate kinase